MHYKNKPCSNDYKSLAIAAAEDFGYGYEVIKKIEKAKTSDEVSAIMARARYAKFKE